MQHPSESVPASADETTAAEDSPLPPPPRCPLATVPTPQSGATIPNPLWADTTQPEFEAAVKAHLLAQGARVTVGGPDHIDAPVKHLLRKLGVCRSETDSRPVEAPPPHYGITSGDLPNASSVAKGIRLSLAHFRMTSVYAIHAIMEEDNPQKVKLITYCIY